MTAMATKTEKTEKTAPATPVFEGAKKAFQPIADAVQSLRANIQVPEAARDFVKRGVGVAQERATDLQAGADKVTKVVETAALGAVGEVAKVSRTVQQAYYDDVQAFFAHVNTLASAKCLSEAFQAQADYLRGRGEVAVSRAKATGEYVAAMVNGGVDQVRTLLAGQAETKKAA
jgi:phasin